MEHLFHIHLSLIKYCASSKAGYIGVIAELSALAEDKKFITTFLNSVLLESTVSTSMAPHVIMLQKKTHPKPHGANTISKASVELWKYFLTEAGPLLLHKPAPWVTKKLCISVCRNSQY